MPGKSGNPSGRPLSKAATITDLTRTVELLARQRVAPERIARIIEATAQAAEGGDNKARKLIFDYFMSKPTVTEEVDDKGKGRIVVVIENATFAASQKPDSPAAIEGEYSEP